MSASIWSPDGTIPSESSLDYIYKRIWLDLVPGQTLVNFAASDPTFVYTPGLQALEVGIDGLLPLQPGVDYTETSTTSITLTNPTIDAGRLYATVGRYVNASLYGLTATGAEVVLYSGNGVQTTFALGITPGTVGNVDVSIDGATQTSADFNLVGTSVVFVSPPPSGTVIYIRYGRSLPIGTVPGSSLTLIPFKFQTKTNVQALADNFGYARSVNAEGFSGYDPLGITDSSAAILLAAQSLGAVGGIVYITGKARIASNLVVPAGVELRGPYAQVASFGSNQDASTYNQMSAILVDSGVSIKLSSGAGINGCFIYRYGMTFPAPNTASFAGTAIIGSGTSFLDGDDINIKNCLIAGFSQAIYTNACQRVKCTDIYYDCLSGIHIENSVDVPYVTRCHGWPFSTIKTYALAGGVNGGNAAEILLQRSGTALKFSNVGDWNKVTDCFSYGYFRGVHVLNCNSITLSNVSTDNTPKDPSGYTLPLLGYPGAVGIWVDGTSFDTRLIGCQAAAQGSAGYRFSTSANGPSRMIGCDAWSPIERCVLVESGDVNILGGTLRNAPDAIVSSSATSRIWIDKVRFNAISGFPYKTTVATTLWEIGADNDYGDFTAGTALVSGALTTPILATAATLNLPATGDEFILTGAVNFGTLVGGHKDRKVRFFFTGTPTVFTGTGTTNNMRLSGAANFVATVGATLSLAHNGTQWYETGRSA